MVPGNGARAVVWVLAGWLWCSAAVAESISAQSFHARVQGLYDFSPHTLDKEGLSVKSQQLDEFWAFVKSNATEALPWLRSELSESKNPSFFYYDGAKLLMSLSNERSDQAIALSSLPKVDFRDIQRDDYLRTVHWFARNGFDTRQAAFRILDVPDFKAFIPQHSLTLAQNYALIYMIFPATQNAYLDDLVQRLKVEPNVRSQKSLLLAIWYTVTPMGVAAIRNFSANSLTHKEAAAYARELLARHASNGAVSYAADALREERMRLMQRPISDEALYEFDRLTMQLLDKQ